MPTNRVIFVSTKQKAIMQTIGFTTQFYTLWQVGEAYEEPIYYNNMLVGSVTKQDVCYIQNLSKDLDAAKAKLIGDYSIDLELCGKSSFVRTLSSNIKDRENYYPFDCFSFGRWEGVKFSDCDDVWQLNRALSQENSARRKANARRRLIELGEIIRHDGKYINPSAVAEYDRNKWIAGLTRGHHLQDGAKVELELMEIGDGGFNGSFGWVSLRTYASKCGLVFKYMGSSPIDISTTEFVKVTATIKHDYYIANQETKLIRMKVKK